MRRCVRRFCESQGVSGKPWLNCIARTRKGKPYFEGVPEIFCSVSHTSGYWGCAVSDAPVGLDMEKIRECAFAAIARRFFHPQEAEFAGEKPEAFFAVWTAKESYVKLLGRGIDDAFADFSVVHDGKLLARLGSISFLPLSLAPGYCMCLCGQRLGEVKQYLLKEDVLPSQ